MKVKEGLEGCTPSSDELTTLTLKIGDSVQMKSRSCLPDFALPEAAQGGLSPDPQTSHGWYNGAKCYPCSCSEVG
jgi:hypothetical protein